MKALFACLLVSLVWGTTASACDLTLDARSDEIAGYVNAGRSCLQTPPPGLKFASEIERGFIDRINAERQARGLSILKVRTQLQPAARFHSLDMSRNAFFEHQGPDGRKAVDRIAAFDRSLLAQSTAENIAVLGPTTCFDHNDQKLDCDSVPGFAPPTEDYVVDDLHQRLMQSPGHRDNILAPDSTHLAVGVARTKSGFWVTQLFANQVGTLPAPLALQLRRDQADIVDPDLPGWGFAGASLQGTDQTLHKFETAPLGTMKLIVRGKTEREEKRGRETYIVTQWLDLSGPALTLAPAKEN